MGREVNLFPDPEGDRPFDDSEEFSALLSLKEDIIILRDIQILKILDCLPQSLFINLEEPKELHIKRCFLEDVEDFLLLIANTLSVSSLARQFFANSMFSFTSLAKTLGSS